MPTTTAAAVSYTHLDVYKRQLLETVRQEGERLDRYIQNLLDMTRVGHGALSPAREWIGVDELVGAATCLLYTSRCV